MAQPLDDRASAGHWMLLRLAGSIPDDTLHQCRAWLAQERLGELARAVAYAARLARVPVPEGDINLLAEFLEFDGADPATLAMLDVGDTPLPPVSFATDQAAVRAMLDWLSRPQADDEDDEDDDDRADRAGGRRAESGAPAGGRRAEPQPPAGAPVQAPADPAERAVVEAAAVEPVRGVWRAWRYPADGAPWPPPRRVFVLETRPEADLPELAAATAQALAGAGEPAPQVEVYPVGATLPAYQHLARGGGALLWAADPDPGIRVAEVFDSVDPNGDGRMRPDHPHLADPERRSVVAYLSAGEPLLIASHALPDVVDRGRGDVVPASFRTDGHWIWNDAATYYLDRYGLAPDPGLLAHVRSRGHVASGPDGAAMHRANAALRAFFTERGRP